MCPICIASLAPVIAGATSTGGLAALFAKALRARARAKGARIHRNFRSNTQEEPMDRPTIVSRSEWLIARKALLTKEKEASRQRDALSAARRALPMVEIDKNYVFEGPNGRVTLGDLFGPHPQLIVYHLMFDPSWEEGCKSCSYLADNFSGGFQHLAARNTAFAFVSAAPIAKLEAFKTR